MLRLQLALRTLRRNPVVTATSVLSLALGIGANTAIFSVFNEVVLRPLPVAEPHDLVNLAAPGPKPGLQSCSRQGHCDEVFSYLMFRDLERLQSVFTGIAAHRLFTANVAYAGQTASLEGLLVSGSYFSVLGLQPAAGRLLGQHDDGVIGGSPVVVLSYGYWRSRFSEDPDVIGDTLRVNGQNLKVVGVAPRGFEGTSLGLKSDVFVPITMGSSAQPGFYDYNSRLEYWAYLFARLRPGVSINRARTALTAQYQAILDEVEAAMQPAQDESSLAAFRRREIRLEEGSRGQSLIQSEGALPIMLLLVTTALVLLIACANIANLLLARGSARTTEMAIRMSVGAGRAQLMTQLLTESILLGLLSGAAGLIVGAWTLRILIWMLPSGIGASITFAVDSTVLLFSTALSLGTGFLTGLYPAMAGSRTHPFAALKAQGQTGATRTAARFRMTLVTGQIALAVVLLACAGLFARSLSNVHRVDLGFNPDNLLTFRLSPELNGYAPERARTLLERIETELRALPGVTGVTASTVPVLAGSDDYSYVLLEGRPAGEPTADSISFLNEIGVGYFDTMGMQLIAGREFTPSDTRGAPRKAIVNEAFANKFNGGENPVGRRMGIEFGGVADIEIVGLARDAKYATAKYDAPPVYFLPHRQQASVGRMTFYVRSGVSLAGLHSAVPALLARIDPSMPVENLRTMSEQVQESIFVDRFTGTLSGAFAALATLLAALGIYGVLAHSVEQRRSEIGLRMALGADGTAVLVMILGRIALVTLVGISLGLGAAVLLGRAAESLLYQLPGTDPTVFTAAAAVGIGVALAAGLVPAYRASRVDPMQALRHE